MSLVSELRRRNVFRVGAAYLVIAWLLLQVADLVLDNIGAPDWVMQVILLLVALGFPLALVLAWAFELTPEGLKRDAEANTTASKAGSGKLNAVIMVGLVLALGYFVWESRFRNQQPDAASDLVAAVDGTSPAPTAAIATQEDKTTLAVLPFANMSADAEQEYFADGLTEEILNSLAQVEELQVTARTSSFHFKGQNLPIGDIAGQLGVEHVIEGSVRRAGDQVRITAQLIRASDGFHLWSETYDRELNDVFQVQEDIASNVVTALDVVLNENQRASMLQSGTRDVNAFISYQKGLDLYMKAHGLAPQMPTLQQANVHLEDATRRRPDFAQAYLLHSDYYAHLLLDAAAGHAPDQAAFGTESEALAGFYRDMDSVLSIASDPERKIHARHLRMLMSDNWTGLADLVSDIRIGPGCVAPLWLHLHGAFGNADTVAEYYRRVTACDPVREVGFMHGAMALYWGGETAQALALAAEGVERLGNAPRLENITNLIELSQDGPYAAESNSSLEYGGWSVRYELMRRARMGQLKEARAMLAQEAQGMPVPDDLNLLLGAVTGDRAMANQYAAAIDQRTAGSMLLLEVAYFCACGEPFDLEHTPRFAAQIQQSGLQWPPATLVEFPAKDW